MTEHPCDVVIFGGGFAGLWTLDRLVRAGYDALLLESSALGEGQSIQAQGIIHGGGKYALRGVRDFAAVEAIRGMPERWRRSLGGEAPDLRAARVLSQRCHLWIPRGGWRARLMAWGWMSVVQKAGLLNARPQALSPDEWPPALRRSAQAVYAMAEPVVSTRTVLAALSALHPRRLLRYAAGGENADLGIELKNEAEPKVTIVDPESAKSLTLRARALVLCAGSGNEGLLRRAGIDGVGMQRRPLRMVVLRGALPPLFGHCVEGGRTAMTVTTHPLHKGGRVDGREALVWQVGGEVAERHGGSADEKGVLEDARGLLKRWLPGVPMRGVEMGSYRAVRAEAASRRHKRPSGVHCAGVAPRILLNWPTKMALSPVLAEESLQRIQEVLGPPEDPGEGIPWPRPAVAEDPWEKEGMTWVPVD